MRDLRHLQTESLGRSLGASDEAIAGLRAFNATVFDAIDDGTTGERLRAAFAEAAQRFIDGLPEDQREDYRALASDLVKGGMGMATPWFRSLLTHDPGGTLALVRCPVLVVIGEKRRAGSRSPQLAVFRAALKAWPAERAVVLSIPSVNHMLQTCDTGALSEYITIDETVSMKVVDALDAWTRGQPLDPAR